MTNTFPIFNCETVRIAVNIAQIVALEHNGDSEVSLVGTGLQPIEFSGDDAHTVWSYFTGEPHPKVTEWAEAYVEAGGYDDGFERRLEIEREARNAYQLVNVLSRAADIRERRKASDLAALGGGK